MEEKIEALLNFLEKYKAKDVALFDVSNEKCEENFVLLANFASCVDNKLFADFLMRSENISDFPEGYNKGEWIVFLLDKIILHTFIPLKREKYNLDKLYQNCKVNLTKAKKEGAKK